MTTISAQTCCDTVAEVSGDGLVVQVRIFLVFLGSSTVSSTDSSTDVFQFLDSLCATAFQSLNTLCATWNDCFPVTLHACCCHLQVTRGWCHTISQQRDAQASQRYIL